MAENTLRSGVQGAAGKVLLTNMWEAPTADLPRSSGQPVETALFGNCADSVAAMAKGRIQLSWMGNKNVIEAVDHA